MLAAGRDPHRPFFAVVTMRDVKAANAVNVVLVDLVKHRLLGDSEGVVSVAIELTVTSDHGSRGCGASARLTRRSTNSQARSPRRGDVGTNGHALAQLELRDGYLRASVTTGFWPVISGQVLDRAFHHLGVSELPHPHRCSRQP